MIITIYPFKDSFLQQFLDSCSSNLVNSKDFYLDDNLFVFKYNNIFFDTKFAWALKIFLDLGDKV